MSYFQDWLSKSFKPCCLVFCTEKARAIIAQNDLTPSEFLRPFGDFRGKKLQIQFNDKESISLNDLILDFYDTENYIQIKKNSAIKCIETMFNKNEPKWSLNSPLITKNSVETIKNKFISEQYNTLWFKEFEKTLFECLFFDEYELYQQPLINIFITHIGEIATVINDKLAKKLPKIIHEKRYDYSEESVIINLNDCKDNILKDEEVKKSKDRFSKFKNYYIFNWDINCPPYANPEEKEQKKISDNFKNYFHRLDIYDSSNDKYKDYMNKQYGKYINEKNYRKYREDFLSYFNNIFLAKIQEKIINSFSDKIKKNTGFSNFFKKNVLNYYRDTKIYRFTELERAYYNLGLTYFYFHNYDLANENLKLLRNSLKEKSDKHKDRVKEVKAMSKFLQKKTAKKEFNILEEMKLTGNSFQIIRQEIVIIKMMESKLQDGNRDEIKNLCKTIEKFFIFNKAEYRKDNKEIIFRYFNALLQEKLGIYNIIENKFRRYVYYMAMTGKIFNQLEMKNYALYCFSKLLYFIDNPSSSFINFRMNFNHLLGGICNTIKYNEGSFKFYKNAFEFSCINFNSSIERQNKYLQYYLSIFTHVKLDKKNSYNNIDLYELNIPQVDNASLFVLENDDYDIKERAKKMENSKEKSWLKFNKYAESLTTDVYASLDEIDLNHIKLINDLTNETQKVIANVHTDRYFQGNINQKLFVKCSIRNPLSIEIIVSSIKLYCSFIPEKGSSMNTNVIPSTINTNENKDKENKNDDKNNVEKVEKNEDKKDIINNENFKENTEEEKKEETKEDIKNNEKTEENNAINIEDNETNNIKNNKEEITFDNDENKENKENEDNNIIEKENEENENNIKIKEDIIKEELGKKEENDIKEEENKERENLEIEQQTNEKEEKIESIEEKEKEEKIEIIEEKECKENKEEIKDNKEIINEENEIEKEREKEKEKDNENNVEENKIKDNEEKINNIEDIKEINKDEHDINKEENINEAENTKDNDKNDKENDLEKEVIDNKNNEDEQKEEIKYINDISDNNIENKDNIQQNDQEIKEPEKNKENNNDIKDTKEQTINEENPQNKTEENKEINNTIEQNNNKNINTKIDTENKDTGKTRSSLERNFKIDSHTKQKESNDNNKEITPDSTDNRNYSFPKKDNTNNNTKQVIQSPEREIQNVQNILSFSVCEKKLKPGEVVELELNVSSSQEGKIIVKGLEFSLFSQINIIHLFSKKTSPSLYYYTNRKKIFTLGGASHISSSSSSEYESRNSSELTAKNLILNNNIIPRRNKIEYIVRDYKNDLYVSFPLGTKVQSFLYQMFFFPILIKNNSPTYRVRRYTIFIEECDKCKIKTFFNFITRDNKIKPRGSQDLIFIPLIPMATGKLYLKILIKFISDLRQKPIQVKRYLIKLKVKESISFEVKEYCSNINEDKDGKTYNKIDFNIKTNLRIRNIKEIKDLNMKDVLYNKDLNLINQKNYLINSKEIHKKYVFDKKNDFNKNPVNSNNNQLQFNYDFVTKNINENFNYENIDNNTIDTSYIFDKFKKILNNSNSNYIFFPWEATYTKAENPDDKNKEINKEVTLYGLYPYKLKVENSETTKTFLSFLFNKFTDLKISTKKLDSKKTLIKMILKLDKIGLASMGDKIEKYEIYASNTPKSIIWLGPKKYIVKNNLDENYFTCRFNFITILKGNIEVNRISVLVYKKPDKSGEQYSMVNINHITKPNSIFIE